MFHWTLRRKEICEPNLCDDAEGNNPCGKCALLTLDAALETSPEGALIQAGAETLDAIRMGLAVRFEELPADEFYAMRTIEEERAAWEEEKREKAEG